MSAHKSCAFPSNPLLYSYVIERQLAESGNQHDKLSPLGVSRVWYYRYGENCLYIYESTVTGQVDVIGFYPPINLDWWIESTYQTIKTPDVAGKERQGLDQFGLVLGPGLKCPDDQGVIPSFRQKTSSFLRIFLMPRLLFAGLSQHSDRSCLLSAVV